MQTGPFRNSLLVAFALALSLVGLTGSANFAAAQEAQDTDSEVLFITLRNKTGSPAPGNFYGDGRSTMSAGVCKVSSTGVPLISGISENVPFRIPDEVLRVTSIENATVPAIFNKVEERAGGEGPVLYIHGYKMDFDKACRRASVFQRNAGLEGRLILFSWPSDGDAVNYMRDEADLSWSVTDIADIIAALDARFGGGRVSIAGHSLGGRGTVLALYDVASRYPDLRLDNVFLLAPDIDFQLFEKLLPHFRPHVDNIKLYVADSDRPLALSAQLHGYPRLGQSGNDVESLTGVDVIDLSDLPIRSASGHLYHVYNPEVGADIAGWIKGAVTDKASDLIQVGTNLWRLQPAREN